MSLACGNDYALGLRPRPHTARYPWAQEPSALLLLLEAGLLRGQMADSPVEKTTALLFVLEAGATRPDCNRPKFGISNQIFKNIQKYSKIFAPQKSFGLLKLEVFSMCLMQDSCHRIPVHKRGHGGKSSVFPNTQYLRSRTISGLHAPW